MNSSDLEHSSDAEYFLSKANDTIRRSRRRIVRQVIMSMLPVVFFFFVKQSNPRHFDIMLKTDIGRMLLGVAFVLQFVGMFLIFKISKIK